MRDGNLIFTTLNLWWGYCNFKEVTDLLTNLKHTSSQTLSHSSTLYRWLDREMLDCKYILLVVVDDREQTVLICRDNCKHVYFNIHIISSPIKHANYKAKVEMDLYYG